MKKNNRLLSLWVTLLSIVFVNIGCQPKTVVVEEVEIQVYDSAQVETIMENALKVEPIGKPEVIKTDHYVRNTQQYKVIVALDKEGHLIKDPNGKENQTIARQAPKGTVVTKIGCEFSCQRHTDSEGCALGGCESDQRGHCSRSSCGSCRITLPCRSIKSALGVSGGLIRF